MDAVDPSTQENASHLAPLELEAPVIEYLLKWCNTLKTTPPQLLLELNKLFESYIKSTKEPFTQHPHIHDCIWVKQIGPNPVQATFPIVVVGKECAEAVLRGAHVYKKGILGAGNRSMWSADRKKPYQATHWLFSESLKRIVYKGSTVSVWTDLDTKVLRGAIVNSPGPNFRFVGNGIAKENRSVLVEQGEGLGVEMTEQLYTNPSLNNIMNDSFFLQTLPSMVVSHVLDPQPGEKILDMCAAPGGKTTHVASLMGNNGSIFAIDKSKGKLGVIRKNCERHHITIVKAFHYDAAKLLSPNNEITTAPPFAAASFDRILLDPPCSGLGNRPRLRDTMTCANLKEFSSYQKKLFSVAVQLLKPGGVMTYSTCTINPDENEEVVSWAIAHYKGVLKLVKAPEHCCIAQEGLSTSSLDEEERKLVLRFDPSHANDTAGFFLAKFEKMNSQNI